MRIKPLLALALSATAATAAADPAEWGVADTVACYNVGPGIEYTKIIFHDKPLIIWHTTIDLTNEHNLVENVVSRNSVPDTKRWDVATYYTENSREGHNVKVAWNHDFFYYDDGVCLGANVGDGEFYQQLGGRSTLAITADRKAEIFRAPVDCRIIAPDGTEVGIDSFNSKESGMVGDCVLFNRYSAKSWTDEGRYIKIRPQKEWRVNGEDIPCEVLEISSTPMQSTATEYVIFLRGSKQTALDGHLNAGDVLRVKNGFGQPVWGTIPQNILNAFHGYPSIARDGVLHEGEYNDFENGREYEESAHLMAGLSKDKTKLYMCLNEMSGQSHPIDCVDMATWMIQHGAWDIVNFDSGGSAAIAVNAKMLNLPGRGSVRPIQDAMIAVSLAPTDNAVTSLGFTKKRMSMSTVALAPLSVVSYNQYGDIVEEGVEGCTFTVVPASLGTVDADGVFHSSTTGGVGKIYAEKDGARGEIDVTTITATDIRTTYPSLLIDGLRNFVIPISGTVDGATYEIDPGAFTWTVDDPTVATVENGLLKGLKEGQTSISGQFEDIALSIGVTVEMGKGKMTVYEAASLPADPNAKLNGVTGLSLRQSLPEGWSDGATFDVEKVSGRLKTIVVSMPDDLYGLPDGMSLRIDNPDGVITRYTFSYVDNLGNRYMHDVNVAQGDASYDFSFVNEDGEAFSVPQYPIKPESLTLYLQNATNASFSIGDLKAVYPESGSSVTPVFADDSDLSVICDGERLTARFSAPENGEATVSVYAANGAKVKAERIRAEEGQNSYTTDTVWLADGIYILSVDTGGRHLTKKFIKR